MTARAPDAGVTLIEMLVALVICTLVGVAGFAMPDAIVRVNDRAEGDLTRLNALDRAFLVIGRDLTGADPRGLQLDAQGGLRIGSDPAMAYMVETDTLIRRVGDPGVARTLLDEITAVTQGALDADGTAYPAWPPEGARPDIATIGVDLSSAGVGAVARAFAIIDGMPE